MVGTFPKFKQASQNWSGDLRQTYVQKFAIAYSLTTLAFSGYFTPQEFNPKTAIPVNLGLFLIGAPYWFRKSRIPPYWLNLTSQLANAGASVWICSFLGPTSHINLVAIPQLILALMMFSGIHPKTTLLAAFICFFELLLPLFPFVNTWYLHKRMKEEGLMVLRAILDVTVFGLSTYQFKIISESWTRLVEKVEEEKALYQNRNEWRKNLLRILSHDIKEPMVHSLLAARNLKRRVSGEENSIVNQIEAAQISIKEMISNVELSNQELDAPAVASSPRLPTLLHSVENVLEKLTPWFESRLREKEIRIDSSQTSREHQLTAAGDAFIYQVFMNLLSNAVKFSPRGATVTLITSRLGDGTVIWQIQDQGDGIPPEALSMDSSLPVVSRSGTEGERGSGLGLKIARSFAEESGIHLTLLSRKLSTSHPLVSWDGPGSCAVLMQRP